MIRQTLFFTTPVSLSLKYDQLEIRRGEGEEVITRPIEDIGLVMIEHPMVRMTVPLLNALANRHVAVVFCDERCMPNAMLMPLDSNTTQQETYRFQVEATLPVRKRIWKEIIENKIRNQAALLDRLGLDGSVLKPYYMNVLSGDSDNREGVAAKAYWRQMFGRRFVRCREGAYPNALLNYGYAILRAAVTRALLGSGLFPAFGLFHRNRYNAFPLADDVMEPYRPFVDSVVRHIYETSSDEAINREAKQLLAKVLFADVKVNGLTRPLLIALSLTTASLVRALKDRKERIVYPTFV